MHVKQPVLFSACVNPHRSYLKLSLQKITVLLCILWNKWNLFGPKLQPRYDGENYDTSLICNLLHNKSRKWEATKEYVVQNWLECFININHE